MSKGSNVDSNIIFGCSALPAYEIFGSHSGMPRIYMCIYIYTYTQGVSYMGPSHIGGGEWIKENKKFLYYFEVLAI